uniref:Ribos_L4_asso_C domain-containing protein n=1 Tax=Heterorhabditis bacteriophora TaxID=37862 RepID=A0A1I7WCE1_HETBA
MAARPLVTVYNEKYEATESQIKLPAVFRAPIRPDVVSFIHDQVSKNKRQAHAVSTKAGMQHSAESWGTGRAVARIPRVRGGISSVVVFKDFHPKILVFRYMLQSVLERARVKCVTRSTSRSWDLCSCTVKTLIVLGLSATSQNVERLNILKLAPGGHLGRLLIWTESAFKKLDAIYGNLKANSSEMKKGWSVPIAKITNADVSRMIRSEEIVKAVRPVKKNIKTVKLNPYATALRCATRK